MYPAPPAALQLAQRLRQLRQQHWPDARLTQQKLAVAFSAEENLAAATVSSWESLNSPKLPPRHRLLAYARFFATARSVAALPELLPLEDFAPEERAAYKKLETELLSLRNAASGEPPAEEFAFSRTWHFADNGPATFVCAQLLDEDIGTFGKTSSPNYTELHSFADVDALMELHGHIRAENPLMTVHYKVPAEVQSDDLTGHLILLGGVIWNEITERLSEMTKLPVRQVTESELPGGDIFVAEIDGKEQQFRPKWSGEDGGSLTEDVGLLARMPNLLNSSRTLTICNGIYSRGVYGAVRSLTDARLRDGNERYIAAKFGGAESFAILMAVQVINNKAMTPDFNSPGVVLYELEANGVV
jgi:hypothetical protein